MISVKKEIIFGDKYGLLTLTGKWEYRLNSIKYIEAVCECGVSKFYIYSKVLSGHTKSCGCYSLKSVKERSITHGLSRGSKIHPIIHAYRGIRQRCYNEKSRNYYNYGGRGILLSTEWEKDIHSFIKWSLSNGWAYGLTLDRIDNNKGYSADNCRWTTYEVQNKNRRDNHWIFAFGETKCLSDWVKDDRCTVGENGLLKRLRKGLEPELAITKPSIRK